MSRDTWARLLHFHAGFFCLRQNSMPRLKILPLLCSRGQKTTALSSLFRPRERFSIKDNNKVPRASNQPGVRMASERERGVEKYGDKLTNGGLAEKRENKANEADSVRTQLRINYSWCPSRTIRTYIQLYTLSAYLASRQTIRVAYIAVMQT